MPQRIERRYERSRLVVPVTVLAPYPRLSLTGHNGLALIDTGSTTTGVKADVVRRLELPRRGKRPMSGVGGELQIDRCLFRIGLVGDQADDEGPNFPYVFEDIIGFELLDSFGYDVLLGMDILTQCGLTMDAGRCALTFG